MERSLNIKVDFMDVKGKKRSKRFKDWEARIFQHEYDHLDGVLYIDRLSPEGRQKVRYLWNLSARAIFCHVLPVAFVFCVVFCARACFHLAKVDHPCFHHLVSRARVRSPLTGSTSARQSHRSTRAGGCIVTGRVVCVRVCV